MNVFDITSNNLPIFDWKNYDDWCVKINVIFDF